MSAGKPPPPAPACDATPERQGQRWLGALVPRIARPAFRRRSPAAAALMADWAAVVGPALAAVTQPLRLSRPAAAKDGAGTDRAGRPGTLAIRCSGPVALELQHLAPQLIERINAHAGFPLVGALRFERGTVVPPPASPRLPPTPPPDEAAVAAVTDPDLRAALARMRSLTARRTP